MQTYAEQFIKDMENLNIRIGNNQQKKRYIIVSYDEAGDLEQLSDNEKAAYGEWQERFRPGMYQFQ